ncbi:MAG: hypothetical protein UV73_C0001G0103 [Candidatus Gottesmanbacteria bacterium GW2011_GWA2_43_14]|uniref:Cohesin domain-containing protein n=1 Tax=Candidatus Gottesmanbacteria bacterium GW2011_GWA2_43_14 TaxID=1618443 RepID=A0A0G1DLY1_9BACT|nr:MAG: hypothetical protein UV73_C0001G0103 [Candidatus Gottesmanbacteria bacterium GW2011_GWA2_43_14]
MKRAFIVAIVLILVLGGGIMLLRKNSQPQAQTELIPTPTAILPTVTDDVKVEVIPLNGNRSITLKISGIPAGTSVIEYELTYVTGNDLPRGVLGEIKLDEGEEEVTRDDIVLGTCSSGKCVYDTGVEKIDLSLKFTGTGGISVFQKSYNL